MIRGRSAGRPSTTEPAARVPRILHPHAIAVLFVQPHPHAPYRPHAAPEASDGPNVNNDRYMYDI